MKKLDVIYEPSGRALEYSPLALNIATGCIHGCAYCYAPACMRRKKDRYHSEVIIKKNIVARVEKDLFQMDQQKIVAPVLLCFVTDPYQNEAVSNITGQILSLFAKYGQNFQILTKGGTRAVKHFHHYKPGDKFAVTLTFDDPQDSAKIEPGAALPQDRIESLSMAHQAGIETWVSFEPVLDDEQVFRLFEKTVDFVDLYKIGKVSNFQSRVKDWGAFAWTMKDKCERHGKQYLIKEDLKACM